MSIKKLLLSSLLFSGVMLFSCTDDATESLTDSIATKTETSGAGKSDLIGTWYENGKEDADDTIIITETTFEYRKKYGGTPIVYGIDGAFAMENGLVTETIDGEVISRHEYEYEEAEGKLRIEVNAGTVNFDGYVTSMAEDFYRE